MVMMVKKRVVIILMLLVHLALIGQEITLHQVECIKNNNTSDIEFAVGQFLCQCDHQHVESDDPSGREIHTPKKCCYDILLNTCLFERSSSRKFQQNHKTKTICLVKEANYLLDHINIIPGKQYRDIKISKLPETALTILSTAILIQ